MIPKYLEWSSFSTVAISGQSGSGKTSTVRFIIAQLLLNNVSVYVCDPHGNAGSGSLRDSIIPIESFLAAPIAIDIQDRMTMFRTVYQIWRNRKDGKDRSTHKIAIILDEATSHFIESTKDQVNELATILQSLTNEGRKNNIRCFLLSQNWKSDFIGSRSVRSSITHVIFHRTNSDEVKLFVPSMPARELRSIASLSAGNVFVYPYMYKLRVPYISQDDIVDFAKRYRSRSPHRATIVQSDARDYNAERANVQGRANTQESIIKSNIARCIKEILIAKRQGKTKEQTIYDVFQIRKSGSSERWKIASRFYDNVLRRANENT